MLDQENSSQSACKRRKPAESEKVQSTKLDNELQGDGISNIESGALASSSNDVNHELSSVGHDDADKGLDEACKTLNDVACCSSTTVTKNGNDNCHQTKNSTQINTDSKETIKSTQINTDSKETTSEKSDQCRARRNYKSRNYRNRLTLCTSSSDDNDEGAANATVITPSANVSSSSSSSTEGPSQKSTVTENIALSSTPESADLVSIDNNRSDSANTNIVLNESAVDVSLNATVDEENAVATADVTTNNTESAAVTDTTPRGNRRSGRGYRRNYRNRLAYVSSPSSSSEDAPMQDAPNAEAVEENTVRDSSPESNELASNDDDQRSDSANTNIVLNESAVDVSLNATVDEGNAVATADVTTNNTESAAGTDTTPRGNRRSGRGNRRNYRNRLAYVSSPSSSSEDAPMQDAPNAEAVEENTVRDSSPESNELASNDDDAPESSDVSLISSPDIQNVFHRHLFSSSSSDNDTSNTDEVMNESMAEEANNEQAEALHDVLNKPKPTYTWNSTYELMRREHGLSGNGRYSLRNGLSTGFNTRFYASRHVVERMNFLHPLRKHTGCVNCLNFNRSGNLLCTGSDDTQVVVWDWAHKKVKHSYKSGHTANIFQTKFIENGNTFLDIISAGRDGEVRRAIIPTSGGKISTKRLYKHRGPVHKLVVCPQSPSEIISVGEDGYIRHHDLRKETEASDMLKLVKVNNKKIRLFSISHHPFNAEIVVCGCDRFVRVYDKRNMSDTVHEMCPEHLLETTIPQVTCSVYNSNGSEILSSYSDDHIYLFNNKCYKKGDYMHRYRGHYNNKTIKGVNFFGPNSEYVISGSDCSNIFFWDKNTEAILNCMPGDTLGVVNCLEPHPSIPILATSGLDHNVKIWAPNSETYPPDLSKLSDRVKRNLRRSVLEEANEIDNRQFNYFIRQFLSNSYARTERRAQSDNAAESRTLSSSSSSDDDDDDDDDYRQIDGVNCRTQ